MRLLLLVLIVLFTNVSIEAVESYAQYSSVPFKLKEYTNPSGLVTDSDGNIYIVGTVSDTTGFTGIFVQKTDKDGNYVFDRISSSVKSSGADFGYGIAIDYNDSIYITGSVGGH